MLNRFLGNNGTREQGPSAQELKTEQENVHNALRLATETGQPQSVRINGKEHRVISDGYGKEIRPA
ncbi:MAG: hypothetical protein NTV24_01415 [Candidatus Woesebacteria bacterium]|nr:hypothetical protein [Candidatus Woesebacteria bacterium]